MHEAEPYGHLLVCGKPPTAAQLGRSVGASAKVILSLLDELEEGGVLRKNESDVIFSKWMIQDRETLFEAQKNGKNGENPAIIAHKGLTPPLTPTDKRDKKEYLLRRCRTSRPEVTTRTSQSRVRLS